ncbi:hypothetical protein BK007_10005 [Methanobacterium subterraneum]|uniref:DUF2357 domain-containing protein n=1 Tax=Methanobacterium subterraneum TaxID=59277 RepID=A0A2H4VE00_9EURY|nr:DUF2357 domain-containing protein [Methanobacterium subterraneum]AUB56314.1 hypothetical protein BK007_10005 [Methanobacterium subterraneum]
MVGQQIKLKLRSETGQVLGFLVLKTNDKNLVEKNKFKVDGIKFINVPRVQKPDNQTSIQYLDSYDNNHLSPLMLLEETRYDVMFETTLHVESDEHVGIFPTLHKDNSLKFSVFDRLNFDLSSGNESRFIGILNFHSFVGKSFLDVEVNGIRSEPVPIEVRSKKIKYYEQYPHMIADLSEVASGLIYEMDSPLYQNLGFEQSKRETLYEDFMFLEYLFRPENFPSSYDYIVRNLYSLLVAYLEDVPSTFASNIGPSEMIDIISRPEHLYHTNHLPNDWPDTMRGYVPDVISQRFYHENIDTPENRLLKYFLESLDKVINQLLSSIEDNDGYIKDQLLFYKQQVQDYLSDRWTAEVGRMDYLPLNSQVLQKKEGYRDIFKYFLNFELAFRLEWEEVEDKIKGYERKLSELYEYWCYFKLIKVLNKLSGKKLSYNDLYTLNKDNWSIKVKKGTKSVQQFILQIDNQEIYTELMYNRLFSNNTLFKSYSLPFRPDYTLLIEYNSEHYFVHFDAKYRSEGEVLAFYENIPQEQLNEDDHNQAIENEIEKRDLEEETRRKFKYGDLYKMHTYKDAILKTEGAYVLYPGDDCKIFKVNGNEPIPSVGAFPLTPGKNGIEEDELTLFLKAVLKNIIN